MVAGRAIDLLSLPWSRAEAHWKDPGDYTETQRLGRLVRESGSVAWIRYASVRAPEHVCAAVFDLRSLSMVTPDGRFEPWHCHATCDRVAFSNGRLRFDF